MTLERADMSIRYRPVQFSDPDETLLLPCEITSSSDVAQRRIGRAAASRNRSATIGASSLPVGSCGDQLPIPNSQLQPLPTPNFQLGWKGWELALGSWEWWGRALGIGN